MKNFKIYAIEKGFSYNAIIIFASGCIESRLFKSYGKAKKWLYTRPAEKARNYEYNIRSVNSYTVLGFQINKLPDMGTVKFAEALGYSHFFEKAIYVRLAGQKAIRNGINQEYLQKTCKNKMYFC